MKITIDTQQESKEHLQHLIHLLQKILENRAPQSSESSVMNDAQPGIFNMFSSDDPDKPDDVPPEPQPEIEQDIELIPY